MARIKLHTTLMYINAFVAMFSLGCAVFVWLGVHYADWSLGQMAITCIYNLIITIYASLMTCRYERSIEKLKAKLKGGN